MSTLDICRMAAGLAYCAHGLLIRAYMSLDDGDMAEGSSLIFLLRVVRSMGESSLGPAEVLRFMMAVGGERAGLAGLFVLKSSTSEDGGSCCGGLPRLPRLPGDTVASKGTSYGGKLDSLLGDPPLILDGLLLVSL